MACYFLWSSIRMESSMTLYWNPSTKTTAKCFWGCGGYSMPKAGLWTMNLAYWGSTGFFLMRDNVLLFLQRLLFFFLFVFASFLVVFSSDRPWYSRDIFSCAAWCKLPRVPSDPAPQRRWRSSLHFDILTVGCSCNKGSDISVTNSG